MTAKQPHPFRCETCKNTDCNTHPLQKPMEYLGSPISSIVHAHTAEKGCSGHSSSGKCNILLEQFANLVHKECNNDRHWEDSLSILDKKAKRILIDLKRVM